MKYVALLRGVNVGGKNVLRKGELAAAFVGAGFEHVATYINSGNVVFSAEAALPEVRTACTTVVSRLVGPDAGVCVVDAPTLVAAITAAPPWWGQSPDASHNAIFVIPPMTTDEACRRVGDPIPQYEQVAARNPVIFWSATRATRARARWSRVVGLKAVYTHITIRNANTTRALAAMAASPD